MGANTVNQLLSAAQVPVEALATSGLENYMWPSQTELVDNSTHDYIVVGGGTAGCVVARRLAEDGTDSVLLLEAGDHPPIAAFIAALFPLLVGSYVDYNYTSTLDPYAARGQNNYTQLTAGNTLGGSAAINHFIYGRGSPYDYDEWATITNDESWNYDNVLKYFKKSEKVLDDEIMLNFGDFHGTEGPIGLTRELQNSTV